MKKTKYGPKSCPADKIGENFDNPNKHKFCRYKDNVGSRIKYTEIYEDEKYGNVEGLSLYHPRRVTDKNGIEFYPVGSVWRGKIDKKQPKTNERLPSGVRLGKEAEDDIGPIKETILVSGDVKSPQNYVKIWNSKEGCPTCQEDRNVTVWKPIPPKGYKCLGDVAKEGTDKPDLDSYIKCVPDKCVEEIYPTKSYGNKVWNTSNMNVKYFNSKAESKFNKPNKIEQSTPLSLYQSGTHNAMEERNNRPGMSFDNDGGYNLFASVPSLKSKPSGKAYKIKGSCLFSPRAKSMYKEFNDKGFGLTGGTDRDTKYSIFEEYGKPPLGIIRNKDKSYSPNGKGKAYYLKDSQGPICNGNSYFIKSYNKETNKFSDCIIVKNENEIIRNDLCFKNETSNVWKIVPLKDQNGNNIKDKYTGEIEVYIESNFKFEDGTPRYFKQHYDNRGLSYESITMNPTVWLFKSIVGDLVPNNLQSC